MISFKKLVENKRAKMLFLAIFLTISVIINQSAGINLTYIVKKEGDKLQPNCIAEENERYSAVGWIYPIPNKEDNEPNITTKFIPTIHNDFNCKFSKNDKCNSFWLIKNWEIDENSTRTLDLIVDSRWEDFPVITTGNGGKDFKDRIEIPHVFKAGFSLRSSNSVELLICEGWNPHTYPCYHLNMSLKHIFLRKYQTLPANISGANDKFLDSYEAFANIFSGDEWRNFIINLDDNGTLSLNDVSANRTVIQYEDKKALKPLYLLVRSTRPAQWKIHQNHFFYTKTTQISRLGPYLNLVSKNLCVAFYVSTCNDCVMSFIMTGEGIGRQILKTIEPTKDFEWRLVKLKKSNIMTDKLTIFVETKFVDGTKKSEGFWAVDDVRVCHENEVKVTFLKLKTDMKESDDISCQVVQHPKWRPKKLVYSEIKDFPIIEKSANSTAIYLNWTQEDPKNQINYFITYEGNDICTAEPFNMERVKSNGFLMTKLNEITIGNLIPYTRYNVTFSSMLHEKEKTIFITTSETELPRPKELPNKLQIQQTDTEAYVSWKKIDCNFTYGHLIYSLKLTNVPLNITKDLGEQTENAIEIKNLQPYTLYTLNIRTARNLKQFEKSKDGVKYINYYVNFTTNAGLAPPPQNIEIYLIDNSTISLRYDLPKKPKGIPEFIQIQRCNPLTYNKCRSTPSRIRPCKLWPRKYCVDIMNLVPNQNYTFRISLKNANINMYGQEVMVSAITSERVPGPPTNLTYHIVDCKHTLDYCHLNISWLHPYNQNGTITSFDLVLNSTGNIMGSKSIHEMLNIVNKTYLPKYQYQIKFIPYSTHYELYIRSRNSIYTSDYTNIHVKTDDIGNHINQSPKLLGESDKSLIFQLPSVDPRLKSYTLTTIVQDFNKNVKIPQNISKMKKIYDELCHDFGNIWILKKVEILNKNNTQNFTIGTENENNKYLKPNTQYCITFIVTNHYKNTEHDVVYYKKLKTPESPPPKTGTSSGASYNHLYVLLLLLLLLIPVGFLVYRYVKKRRSRPRQQETKENVYESLPFEEYDESGVNNKTYDQLLHK